MPIDREAGLKPLHRHLAPPLTGLCTTIPGIYVYGVFQVLNGQPVPGTYSDDAETFESTWRSGATSSWGVGASLRGGRQDGYNRLSRVSECWPPGFLPAAATGRVRSWRHYLIPGTNV